MPVLTLMQERFSKIFGENLTIKEMSKHLPWLGLDIEEEGINYIRVEYNPNRIDLSSYAGIARALQGLMERKTGLKEYKQYKGDIVLKIDSSIHKIRPYMLGAVIREIELDDGYVQEIMEIQEDIHWCIGRNRVKTSIGVHNLDSIKAPFTYFAANPYEHKFIPLGKTEEMTLEEILQKHEKGIAYKHLVEQYQKYPLLIDSERKVLSMPPIINGELTRVTKETQNLFLDVTGTDFNSVEKALNILVTALADTGGKIEKIQIVNKKKKNFSPNLIPQHMSLRTSYTNELIGLKLSTNQIINCLKKCRLGAKKNGRDVIEVLIPPYRIDILHEVDLVEEVAIGYGYYQLEPETSKTNTIGGVHELTKLSNVIRDIMIGLNYTEVMNFIITNEDVQYKKMRIEPNKNIKIANPTSLDFNIARTTLLPSLMKNLKDNKHKRFPQKLFEVSDVILIDEKSKLKSKRLMKLAGVSSHSRANFTEIKAVVESLLSNIGFTNIEILTSNNPSFLKGRVAKVKIQNEIGFFGEIHPEVLNNFELENPVSGFELDLELILTENL